MRALAAIFIRALREHARSRMLAVARGTFASMVVWIFVLQAWTSPVAPGLQFLYGILFLNVLFILLAATSYFASSITEEKEEGTIALLTIAGVSPTGLLLAKSTTRILEGILLLAVQLPFALLAVTLGGVMWDQVIASYIALGGFLVLSGNLALLASVIATRTTAAGFGTAAMLVALLIGDNLLDLLGLETVAAHWHSLDPFARLGETTSLNFAGVIFSTQFSSSLIVGALAFVAARLLFGRFSSPTADFGPGWLSRFSSTARDRRYAPRPVPRMAIEWKDFHFLYGGNRLRRWKQRGYIILSVIVAFACIQFLGGINHQTIVRIGGCVTVVGILGMLVEHAYAASRMLRGELDEKTLGTLLVTPSLPMDKLLEDKERIAETAIIPARRTAISGFVIALLGCFTLGSERGTIMAMTVIILSLGIFLPFSFINSALIREITVYFSLRFPSGSMAIGLAVWLLFTIVTAGTLAVLIPIAGAYIEFFPAYLLARRLRKKNLVFLEKLAANEG